MDDEFKLDVAAELQKIMNEKLDGSMWNQFVYDYVTTGIGAIMLQPNIYTNFDILNIPTVSQKCEHQWQTYEGLVAKYDFCSKCDEKRKN